MFGDNGRDIIQGRTGLKGDKGQKGMPGMNGPEGYTGRPGLAGFPGMSGAKGAPGMVGLPGFKVKKIPKHRTLFLRLIHTSTIISRETKAQLEIQSRDVLGYKVPQEDPAYQESMEIEVDQGVWAQMAIKGLEE